MSKVQIASLQIEVSEAIADYLTGSYEPFLIAKENQSDVYIDEAPKPDREFVCCEYREPICVYHSKDEREWFGYSYGNTTLESVVFSREEPGRKYVIHSEVSDHTSIITDGIVSSIIGNALLYREGLIFHASAVEYHGSGILFVGRSGIGKSTQAGLWADYKKADILNHDKPIVFFEDGQCKVSGSPWSGSVYCHKQKIVPLRAIVFLDQGSDNELKRMRSVVQMLPALTENCCTPFFSAEEREMILNVMEKIIDSVPIYRFVCRPDETAVGALWNELFGGW